jgi:undecaprenyl-diphosphatase
MAGRDLGPSAETDRHRGGSPLTVRRRWADGAAALGGLGLLALLAFTVRDETVGSAEARVFHAVNGLPDLLSPAMQWAQLLGVLAVGPLVAVAALFLRRWRLAAAAIFVTVGKLAAERMVWEVVQRPRPGTSIRDAIVRGDTPTAGASFVSGHVVLTTGLAWIVTPYLRGRWRLVPWAVVALVAFARIYLGAHAPLDVAGGIALGIALGGLVNLLVGTPAWAPVTRR